MTNRQLFLDCDGVLANFDDYAERVLNLHPRKYELKHGANSIWPALQAHDGFYRNLAVLPEGRKLFEAVKHLNPILLTGCPEGGWAESQKKEWAAEHFPGTEIITCRSAEKYKHMKQKGDVLVDDYLKYRQKWIDAKGIFVHYTDADTALAELAELFDLRVPPPAAQMLFSQASQA
jgi:5'(3')-deoxyribonucleotidase